MSRCPGPRRDLGAHVLHGLSPEEAEALEGHLGTCPACRAERDELAEAAALLALARSAPPPVPARVRDRVVADAARRRSRQRWAAVAAVLLLLAGLGGAAAGRLLAPPSRPAVAVALEPVEPFSATGWATFSLREDDLLVELDLQELDPLPAPAAYEAWASTVDDRVLSIGQLVAAPDGAVTTTLVAEGPPERYRGFWITAEPDAADPAHEGPTVLRAQIPPTR